MCIYIRTYKTRADKDTCTSTMWSMLFKSSWESVRSRRLPPQDRHTQGQTCTHKQTWSHVIQKLMGISALKTLASRSAGPLLRPTPLHTHEARYSFINCLQAERRLVRCRGIGWRLRHSHTKFNFFYRSTNNCCRWVAESDIHTCINMCKQLLPLGSW